MFVATDLKFKLVMASLLRHADKPCRRLFIDYRGLTIIGNWVVELAWTPVELDLKIELLDALAILPIPDKQVLQETKLWQTVTRWSTATKACDAIPPPSEAQSRTTSPTPVKPETVSVKSEVDAKSEVQDMDVSFGSAINEVIKPETKEVLDGNLFAPLDASEEPAPPGGEIVDFGVFKPTPTPETTVKLEVVPAVDKDLAKGEAVTPIKEEKKEQQTRGEQIAKELSEQKVERQETGLEKVDENTANEVEAITKADTAVEDATDEEKAELEDKTRIIQTKAVAILESWQTLQEVKFKIPKAQRIQHEREVDEAASHAPPATSISSSKALIAVSNKPWSYYETWKGPSVSSGRPDSPPNNSNNIVLQPGSVISKPSRKRQRPSRFDDETGELHNPRIDRYEICVWGVFADF